MWTTILIATSLFNFAVGNLVLGCLCLSTAASLSRVEDVINAEDAEDEEFELWLSRKESGNNTTQN